MHMGPWLILEWHVLGRVLVVEKLALRGENLHLGVCVLLRGDNISRTWVWLCVILCLCDLPFRCSSQAADSSQVQDHEERVSKHLEVHYNLWLHQPLHQKMVLDKTGKISLAAMMQSFESLFSISPGCAFEPWCSCSIPLQNLDPCSQQGACSPWSLQLGAKNLL